MDAATLAHQEFPRLAGHLAHRVLPDYRLAAKVGAKATSAGRIWAVVAVTILAMEVITTAMTEMIITVMKVTTGGGVPVAGSPKSFGA